MSFTANCLWKNTLSTSAFLRERSKCFSCLSQILHGLIERCHLVSVLFLVAPSCSLKWWQHVLLYFIIFYCVSWASFSRADGRIYWNPSSVENALIYQLPFFHDLLSLCHTISLSCDWATKRYDGFIIFWTFLFLWSQKLLAFVFL